MLSWISRALRAKTLTSLGLERPPRLSAAAWSVWSDRPSARSVAMSGSRTCQLEFRRRRPRPDARSHRSSLKARWLSVSVFGAENASRVTATDRREVADSSSERSEEEVGFTTHAGADWDSRTREATPFVDPFLTPFTDPFDPFSEPFSGPFSDPIFGPFSEPFCSPDITVKIATLPRPAPPPWRATAPRSTRRFIARLAELRDTPAWSAMSGMAARTLPPTSVIQARIRASEGVHRARSSAGQLLAASELTNL